MAKSKASIGNRTAGETPLIVGIGASAGGLEAFKTFFSLMPPDSGMAFVLIQHLDPKRPSLLVDLLSNVTKMRVVEAADGARIAANHVYIIPPDATLTMDEDVLRVSRPAPPREARRPIDAFFSSLAEAQGDNAVCVVLSGGGSDGSVGLTAIKEHGGLTLAQAEIDSQAKLGMPSSAAATGRVDEVLTVEQMPEKLLGYARHLVAIRGRIGADGAWVGAAESLAKITRIVRSVVGHDFGHYKEKTLMRRIQRRMQVLHLDSMDDYVERLRKEPNEVRLLFQEFLISVTAFFRDPEAFAALDTDALAKIVADKGADDQIRVWIAGCATGEEVYSVAILLKERLAVQMGAPPKLQLFATDIDEQAIAQARAGKYRADQLEAVSPAQRRKYFIQDNDHWCPIKDIRDLCVFSVHSAIKDPPFSKLDLVVCRNLLIYLEPPAQDRLLGFFQYALKAGGYLFLGASESVARQSKAFATIDKKHRIFQRRDTPSGSLNLLAGPATSEVVPGPLIARTRGGSEDRLDVEARRAMERHSPAYVVVDARNDVVRFSGNVAKFLGPSPGAASLDLFALLQRPLRPAARAALQKVARTREAAVQTNVSIEIDGASRAIDLIVEPIGDAGSGFCVLAFVDRGVASAGAAGPEGVHDLEQELALTRERLQASVDELETNNEEMKSANEEYQSVNEELQSTNEELETSKEEMQSINEELQTVNAELNAKNDALLRLNSDLKNFLDSTEIATLFLDSQLRVTNFTPAMTDLFHLREGDFGRPVTEIASRFEYDGLTDDVARVLRTLSVIEREVTTSTQRAFIMRIRPYRRLDNVIDGVVVTFIDITERKQLEAERALRSAMVVSSGDAIIGVDFKGTINSWNAGAEALYGYASAIAIGKGIELITPDVRRSGEFDIQARINRGERVASYDSIGVRADGTIVNVSVAISPVKDAAGAITGASLIVRDISDRVRAEGALLESEARYRTLFDLAPIAVYSIDAAGVILQFNSHAAELWGRAPELGDTDQLFCGSFKMFAPDGQFMPHDECPMAEVVSGKVSEVHDAEVLIEREDGSRVAVIVNIRQLKDNDGKVVGAINCFYDITARKSTEARQHLLLQELNHRVKNTLATVQSIASQTLNDEPNPQAFRESFQKRLAAMARTHNLLSDGDWQGSPLRDVLLAEVAPYVDGDAERVAIEGPDLRLTPSASLALGMAFHELATNAAKYGAFSIPDGRVRVHWAIDNGKGARRLQLEWRERDGPTVAPPTRRGLGSRLIERGLAHQLNGDAKLLFEGAGVRFVLEAALDSIEAPL